MEQIHSSLHSQTKRKEELVGGTDKGSETMSKHSKPTAVVRNKSFTVPKPQYDPLKTNALKQAVAKKKREQDQLKEDEIKKQQELEQQTTNIEAEVKEVDVELTEVQDPEALLKALEAKLAELTEQKHSLFVLLKTVLSEDEKRRAAEEAEKRRLEQQKAAEQQALNGGVDSPSPSPTIGVFYSERKYDYLDREDSPIMMLERPKAMYPGQRPPMQQIPYQSNRPPPLELPGGSAVSAVAASRDARRSPSIPHASSSQVPPQSPSMSQRSSYPYGHNSGFVPIQHQQHHQQHQHQHQQQHQQHSRYSHYSSSNGQSYQSSSYGMLGHNPHHLSARSSYASPHMK